MSRSRAPRFPALLVGAFCATIALPALAQPTTYPLDSAYTATKCGSVSSFDPTSDGGSANAERDIVGNATYPALYVTDDGVHAYFRIRLEDDPLVTAGGNKPLAQFGWGVGLDTNNSTADVEYNIIANGITEVVSLVRVSDGTVLQTWQPTLDASGAPPFVPKYVEVKVAGDGSTFGGDGDFFLTIVVPMAAVAAATAADPSPVNWGTIRVWAATSSNGTSLSGDFMCWDDASGTVDLTTAAAGPVTFAATCSDGKKNGGETDVDCGGGTCPACALGKLCQKNTDCLSAKCDGSTKVCVSPCPTAANGADCDGDGLVNVVEDKDGDGVVDANETDPLKADTDGDGVSDGVEDKNKNGVVDTGETDPKKNDSDGDGILDGVEDKDKDGVVDAGETDPLKSDTDGDGLSDGVEDKDKDGVKDAGETDPTKSDTDGDGLTDGIEDKNKNGVKDGQETDPLLWDTDGGGENDGSEVLITGHDPLDPTDDTVSPKPDAGVDQGPKADQGPKPDLGRDGGPKPDRGPGREAGLDGQVPDQGPAGDGPLGDARTDGAQGDGGLPDKEDLFLFGGACGCTLTADGSGAGVGIGLLLAALVVGLLRRRGRGRWLFLPLLLLALDRPASAQTAYFPAVSFQPASSPLNFWVTESAETLPSWVPSAGLYFSYAHRPLELWSEKVDRTVSEVIMYQVNMDLLLALGLGNVFEIGVGLPVTLAQDSQDNAVRLGVIDEAVGAGIGDLRLVPKLQLVKRGPIALAAALPLGLPTGSEENFLGADGVTFTPKAVVTLDTRVIDVGLNVGVRIRKGQDVQVSKAQGSVVVDDDLVLSLGVRVPLWREHLDAVADAFMAMALDEQDKEEIPLEVLGGLRYRLPKGFVANLGAGPGLTRGVGTPIFRAFAGVGYQYQPSPRTKPAPDEDKDQDGILDRDDRCPSEPEDRDTFEDADGCPDPDNDKDGVLDVEDRCPLEAEDRDRFEDTDGCPDPDNDKDGVLDGQDRCPLEPEDRDQFEDTDGCPDPDNDNDMVLDADDRCPNQPETINNIDDQDGCPDQGAQPIQRGKINVNPVFFATAKDVILEKSEPVLKQVAEVLRKNAWIKRVRVEGHTDDRGGADYNTDLSQRRADSVVRFLTAQGIDRGRLEAKGFGPSQPVASNKAPAGRARNRRVEFVIVDPPTGTEKR